MRLSAAVALCCLCTIAFAADPAHASVRKDTNIPAEGLGVALETLAKDYDFQVLYRTEIVKNRRTSGAVGSLTSDEALAKVLSGTGLSYKYLDAGTVTIVPVAMVTSGATADQAQPSSNNTQETPKEAGKKSSQDFRVAQASPEQTQGDASVAKANGKSSEKQKEQLQEVIVTGTRIPEQKDQQIQPVRSYTRDDILASGETTIANFLNTLPDVSTGSFENPSSTYLAQTTVQLHGLPIGTTLVLLDGRRLETGYYGSFDLSNIPASAVERIDVLPVGASAVYGSDALGGAINIILRTNMTGLEVNTKIASAAGTTEKDVDVAFGKSWDRGGFSFLGSYQNQTELLGLGRAITSETTGIPPSVAPNIVTGDCFPGNIYSVNGQNLPGLSSPEAGIPMGLTGKPTIADFFGTAGNLNRCNDDRYFSLVPPATRVGAIISAHYRFSDSADLFAEVLGSHETLESRVGNIISTDFFFSGDTLGANNPYNPFGEPVGIGYSYPGVPLEYQDTETFFRPLVGLRGLLFGGWKYEVTAYMSRDQTNASFPNESNLGNLIVGALNSSNPATALNPFSSGAPGSAQLMQSLLPPPDNFYFVNRATDAQAVLTGPLFRIPSGAVQAVFGGEYARETQLALPASAGLVAPPPISLDRNTYALFTETRIPLLGGNEHIENGDRLVATLAARYDHASDFGGKATWQGGLLWKPTATVSVRAGYSTSYVAPQLQQISGGIEGTFQSYGLVDPFRGGEEVTASEVLGANSNLKPETGESVAFGAVYTSRVLPGFEMSLSYFSVDISNYIGIPNAQAIIDYPTLFPGGVERGPATPQDVQNGFLGPITQVNDLYFNYGDLDIAGIDADVRYALQTRAGQFTPSLAVTDLVRWRSALSPGLPEVSYLSQATITGPGFAPRWKGTAALSWKLDSLSATVTGRYLGPYKDYQWYVPNTNELGNLWLVDLNARYDIGRELASAGSWAFGTYLAIGATNVFDKAPQFSYALGFDPAEADLRGRIVYLNAGLKW